MNRAVTYGVGEHSELMWRARPNVNLVMGTTVGALLATGVQYPVGNVSVLAMNSSAPSPTATIHPTYPSVPPTTRGSKSSKARDADRVG